MQEQARAMNAFFTGSVPGNRYYDDNGFLHITLNFMRTGLLKYLPTKETFPDGVPLGAIGHDGLVTVLVEKEELADCDSLASLSGLDCLRDHEWASPDSPRDAVGTVAGIPEFDGEYVRGEAVIKDAETIRRLELPEGDPLRLIEDSAAYSHVIEWEKEPYGIGRPYAGKQKRIRYNHFVLLPEGEGRAGKTVRVLNSIEKEIDMPDMKEGLVGFYSRKLKNIVFAKNERDIEELAREDARIENQATDGNENMRMEEVMLPTAEQVKEAADTIAALKAKIDELTAQLEEAKAAITGERIAEVAEEIAIEREEIAEALNNNGIMEREKAMNAFKEKKLHGTDLKVFAMNCIREKKGRSLISSEQAKNSVVIDAMWDVMKDSVSTSHVVGAIPAAGHAVNSRHDMRKIQLAKLGYKEGGK